MARYSVDTRDAGRGSTAAAAPPRPVSGPGAARGLARTVWLAAGFGLALDGVAVETAASRPGLGQAIFWMALLLPFAALAMVLCAGRPSPRLRRLTIALVGLYPAIIYRMSSPLILGGFDEHLHERTLLDLLHGGGLFAGNPELQVGPFYPGLELFAGVVDRLTAVPPIVAMAGVVFLCRLLFVLALYECALSVLHSERGAALVVIFYAASPQFYFFTSQFSYETMSLTLGLGGLYFLRRAQSATGRPARLLSALATVTLVLTAVSHHLTSWIFLAFLLAWAAITPRPGRRVILRPTLVMAVAVIIWTASIGSQLAGYLGPVFSAAFSELTSTLSGSTQGHAFASSGGNSSPEWEKFLLLYYAACCSLVALICGVILARRAIRARNPRIGLLAVLTLAYPATLAAHFVPAASDVGDRSSTFFFLPLALSVALVATTTRHPWRTRIVEATETAGAAGAAGVARPRASRIAPLVLGLSLVYIGGVALGAGPGWGLLPGPYLVSAEARTQDPYTLAAVRWATAHLPAGSTVVADRIPADLLASEARLWPISEPKGKYEPALLYFSAGWGSYQASVVKGLAINYIYVDQRLARSLPLVGYYFYPGETGVTSGSSVNITQNQLSREDLAKFARIPGLTAVYHQGPVTIYDTAGMGVPPQRRGYTGARSMGLGAVGDLLLGLAIAGLVLAGLTVAGRRRLRGLAAIAAEAGVVGAALSVIAAAIVAGAVLFELRWVPGPYFSLGALIAAVVFAVEIGRRDRRSGRALRARLTPLRRLDPVVLLGVLAALTGVALSIHTAWHVDVTRVYALLRTAGR